MDFKEHVGLLHKRVTVVPKSPTKRLNLSAKSQLKYPIAQPKSYLFFEIKIMPQLDIYTYFTQFQWFLVIFTLLFILIN